MKIDWKDLLFWPKKEKKVVAPRMFAVPEDKVLDLLVLYDDLNAIKGTNDAVARFYLWSFIEGLFPETKVGKWEIVRTNATAPFIREIA